MTFHRPIQPERGEILPPATREIDSAALLDGAKMITITHRGERYFLRVTRAGKLILTK